MEPEDLSLDTPDDDHTLDDLLGTGDADQDTEEAAETGVIDPTEPGDDERLIDPHTLPDELKPHWSRMTKAYQKRLSAIRGQERDLDSLREQASLVDRFNRDPRFAAEILETTAKRLGYTLTPPTSPRGDEASPAQVDAALVRRIEGRLSPELKFLAPAIADAASEVAREAVRPFQEERTQAKRQEFDSMMDAAFERLSSAAPGWEEYEDEMTERMEWVRNALTGRGPMVHKEYGNVMEWLYHMVAGRGAATAEAGRRLSRAVQNNRSSRSAPGSSSSTNVDTLIQQAKTPQDQWDIAFRSAIAEVRGR